MKKAITKTLDFYPDHATLVHLRRKTRSFRRGDKTADYAVGEQVMLTECGILLCAVEITGVQVKKLSEIQQSDLAGSEFRTMLKLYEALKDIYSLEVLSRDQIFSIIDWRYLDVENRQV